MAATRHQWGHVATGAHVAVYSKVGPGGSCPQESVMDMLVAHLSDTNPPSHDPLLGRSHLRVLATVDTCDMLLDGCALRILPWLAWAPPPHLGGLPWGPGCLLHLPAR